MTTSIKHHLNGEMSSFQSLIWDFLNALNEGFKRFIVD